VAHAAPACCIGWVNLNGAADLRMQASGPLAAAGKLRPLWRPESPGTQATSSVAQVQSACSPGRTPRGRRGGRCGWYAHTSASNRCGSMAQDPVEIARSQTGEAVGENTDHRKKRLPSLRESPGASGLAAAESAGLKMSPWPVLVLAPKARRNRQRHKGVGRDGLEVPSIRCSQ